MLDENWKKKIEVNLQFAGLISFLSLPISIVPDIRRSNEVYDALRSANSNFERMSNAEIWWEVLWMSPESHAGLVNLTKGALFERLVAQDTGGQLHEHFNHPKTDMVISDTETQLKATDSVGYINSVDDDIPVIATSEVAAMTDAIDSGYTDEEITQQVELALGGTVLDIADTTVDAVLAAGGTLGVMAILHGISHASEQHEKGDRH